jgi:hypothetical protein
MALWGKPFAEPGLGWRTARAKSANARGFRLRYHPAPRACCRKFSRPSWRAPRRWLAFDKPLALPQENVVPKLPSVRGKGYEPRHHACGYALEPCRRAAKTGYGLSGEPCAAVARTLPWTSSSVTHSCPVHSAGSVVRA